MSGPLRCPSCGQTDFFVISTGVSYKNGVLAESYHWPEVSDEPDSILDESGSSLHDEVHQALAPHIHDAGYRVEQETLREPELESVEGPIRALCSGCLADMTEPYLQLGREETLPA